ALVAGEVHRVELAQWRDRPAQRPRHDGRQHRIHPGFDEDRRRRAGKLASGHRGETASRLTPSTARAMASSIGRWPTKWNVRWTCVAEPPGGNVSAGELDSSS